MLVREDKNMCFYEIEEYREIQSSRLKKYILKNVYGLESHIFYLYTKLLKMYLAIFLQWETKTCGIGLILNSRYDYKISLNKEFFTYYCN